MPGIRRFSRLCVGVMSTTALQTAGPMPWMVVSLVARYAEAFANGALTPANEPRMPAEGRARARGVVQPGHPLSLLPGETSCKYISSEAASSESAGNVGAGSRRPPGRWRPCRLMRRRVRARARTEDTFADAEPAAPERNP